MNTPTNSLKKSHIAIGVLAILAGALAFMLWQETQTERVEFSFGGQSIEVEAEG